MPEIIITRAKLWRQDRGRAQYVALAQMGEAIVHLEFTLVQAEEMRSLGYDVSGWINIPHWRCAPPIFVSAERDGRVWRVISVAAPDVTPIEGH